MCRNGFGECDLGFFRLLWFLWPHVCTVRSIRQGVRVPPVKGARTSCHTCCATATIDGPSGASAQHPYNFDQYLTVRVLAEPAVQAPPYDLLGERSSQETPGWSWRRNTCSALNF